MWTILVLALRRHVTRRNIGKPALQMRSATPGSMMGASTIATAHDLTADTDLTPRPCAAPTETAVSIKTTPACACVTQMHARRRQHARQAAVVPAAAVAVAVSLLAAASVWTVPTEVLRLMGQWLLSSAMRHAIGRHAIGSRKPRQPHWRLRAALV